MESHKSFIDLIQARNSCRSYAGQEIEGVKMNLLNAFIADIHSEAAEKSIHARFQIVTRQVGSAKAQGKMGTYGFISGANAFLVGILPKSEAIVEQFGLLFEKIVLFATSLGLATCWLGGSFSRADFQLQADLSEQEFIPIVSPIGYARDRRTLFDQLVRLTAGSGARKPWSELFFNSSPLQPLDRDAAGAYAVPLDMVRLGPSASNKQPWRVIKDPDGFGFYLSRTRGYRVAGYDIQRNDLGIAMCHFELTCRELELPGRWEVREARNSSDDLQYIVSWTL